MAKKGRKPGNKKTEEIDAAYGRETVDMKKESDSEEVEENEDTEKMVDSDDSEENESPPNPARILQYVQNEETAEDEEISVEDEVDVTEEQDITNELSPNQPVIVQPSPVAVKRLKTLAATKKKKSVSLVINKRERLRIAKNIRRSIPNAVKKESAKKVANKGDGSKAVVGLNKKRTANDLLLEALRGESGKTGISMEGVKKYIVAHYPDREWEKLKPFIKKSLVKSLDNDTVIRAKGSNNSKGVQGKFLLNNKIMNVTFLKAPAKPPLSSAAKALTKSQSSSKSLKSKTQKSPVAKKTRSLKGRKNEPKGNGERDFEEASLSKEPETKKLKRMPSREGSPTIKSKKAADSCANDESKAAVAKPENNKAKKTNSHKAISATSRVKPGQTVSVVPLKNLLDSPDESSDSEALAKVEEKVVPEKKSKKAPLTSPADKLLHKQDKIKKKAPEKKKKLLPKEPSSSEEL